MLAVTEDFYRVLRYAHRWGVDVRIEEYDVPDPWPDGWTDAPSSMAHVEWPARRIWWSPSACDDSDAALALLHEVAHCVDPVSPDLTDEVEGPLLAFEFYSTRLLGITGRTVWMRRFGLGSAATKLGHFGTTDWRDISNRDRHTLIMQSLARAIEAGTLDAQGRPTYRLPKLDG
jgi:hypothetical protein